MVGRLDDMRGTFDELTARLADPDVLDDPDKMLQISKQRADAEEVVNTYEEYQNLEEELSGATEMFQEADDAEMRELAREEVKDLEERIKATEDRLALLLIPKDPMDEKNVMLEIRAGTGGGEAAIWAGDLVEAYTRYAKTQGWQTRVVDASPGDDGGYRQYTMEVTGQSVYSKLKFESGVHRVQRVPDTETQGRIHTSAATVAVLPEAEDVDVAIKNDDLRIETMRAQGAGGQHVNKTDSAVRITHIPTGIAVAVQQERSQHQNRAKAMQMLKARLYEVELQKREAERLEAEANKTDIGWGHQIRSYVLQPYQMVKDLRTNVERSDPQKVLDGDLDEFMEGYLRWRRSSEDEA